MLFKLLAVICALFAADAATTWYGLTFAEKSELNPLVPTDPVGVFGFKALAFVVTAGIVTLALKPPPAAMLRRRDVRVGLLTIALYVAGNSGVMALSNLGEILFDRGLADLVRTASGGRIDPRMAVNLIALAALFAPCVALAQRIVDRERGAVAARRATA